MEWFDIFWKRVFLICCLYRALFLMSSKEKKKFYHHQKNIWSPHWSIFCGEKCVGQSRHVFLSIYHSPYLHGQPFPNSFLFALWTREDPQKRWAVRSSSPILRGLRAPCFCLLPSGEDLLTPGPPGLLAAFLTLGEDTAELCVLAMPDALFFFFFLRYYQGNWNFLAKLDREMKADTSESNSGSFVVNRWEIMKISQRDGSIACREVVWK